MLTEEHIASRIGIAKHWFDVAEKSGANNVLKNRTQRTAERMGRNECAWLLNQHEAGVLQLGEDVKQELQLLVARYSPKMRSVKFTSFEGRPKYTSPVTASLL